MEVDNSTSADSLFLEDFLFARNRDWIPKIEEIIRQQPSFIAVGALHLAGDEGLITMLRKQGYTIEPVK